MEENIIVYFNTYEEINKAFPIGFIYRREEHKHRQLCYYYNNADINYYKAKYGNECIKEQTEDTFILEYVEVHEFKVEGYIYDGIKWCPAYFDNDSWKCIIFNKGDNLNEPGMRSN